MVIERRGRLTGYELYLVEQWACSRIHPTFVITTFTGDPSHSVLVGVLGVPADEEEWSPRLRVYFKAISQFHARPKETPLGMLMVTNLTSFPSGLTVISVPDGDVRHHREDFIVNENLKRLGCSGRSGMSLAPPAGATQAKFFQLYKTSEKILLYGAVIELVKLCQVALMMFGKLEQEYADGMLCDVTEKAINDWWIEIGSEFYNIEPTDGILGPTTVAALLGMLMGARNRLNYSNAPVSKDAFDVAGLKRGIAYFQKAQKMERTRRLDRHTLNRLHKVTAKAAAGEGWAVPKAVKSTVVELSGKGGEMVTGMLGRDKAGIGDIETLDIDRFVSLVHGERAKWLWYGKPRRNGSGEGRSDGDAANLSFTKDDQGGYIWSHHKSHTLPLEEDSESRKKDNSNEIYSAVPPDSAASGLDSPSEREMQLRKAMFKGVTGKMSDARSGFGRIKDAVGFRGHNSKQSKDYSAEYDAKHLGTTFSPSSSTTLATAPSSPQPVGKSFTWKNTPEDYHNGSPKIHESSINIPSPEDHRGSESPYGYRAESIPAGSVSREEIQKDNDAAARWAEQVKDIRQTLVATDPSVAGSAYGDGDLEGPVLGADREANNFQALLHRRHSIALESLSMAKRRNDAWYPRRMSASEAEEAILSWEPIGTIDDNPDESDAWAALQRQRYLSEGLKDLFEKVLDVQDNLGPWTEHKISNIESLDDQAERDQEGLQNLLIKLSDSYQAVKQASQDILGDERSHVMETIKDVEVLGAKLEYEINALLSKVQDVEDGVSQFVAQVNDLEARAVELETHLNTETWGRWLMRAFTGTHPREGGI